MTPDDALKAECEQWIRDNQGIIQIHRLEPTINSLVRLCREREAETWREAALIMKNAIEPGDAFTECKSRVKECEAQAREGEQ